MKNNNKIIALFWIFVSIFTIGKYIYQAIYEKTYSSNITLLFLGIVLLILGLNKMFNKRK